MIAPEGRYCVWMTSGPMKGNPLYLTRGDIPFLFSNLIEYQVLSDLLNVSVFAFICTSIHLTAFFTLLKLK